MPLNSERKRQSERWKGGGGAYEALHEASKVDVVPFRLYPTGHWISTISRCSTWFRFHCLEFEYWGFGFQVEHLYRSSIVLILLN